MTGKNAFEDRDRMLTVILNDLNVWVQKEKMVTQQYYKFISTHAMFLCFFWNNSVTASAQKSKYYSLGAGAPTIWSNGRSGGEASSRWTTFRYFKVKNTEF